VSLRFHWRLPQTGEDGKSTRASASSAAHTGVPDLDSLTHFCRTAEVMGIDSLLVDFGWGKPDPITLSTALGLRTSTIRFIIAWRSGLISPTMFVQQLNTLSTLIGGRFSLNIVGGHSPDEQRGYGDFLLHDERYARTDEFLGICNAFWYGEQPVDFTGKYYTIEQGKVNTPFLSPNDHAPERYIAGNSAQARELAMRQGSCWMMMAEPVAKLRDLVPPVLVLGKTVGIRAAVIARATREEAHHAAYEMVGAAVEDHQKESAFIRNTDSPTLQARFEAAMNGTDWITPVLWNGALRSHGPASTALVGSYDDVAAALLEYGQAGVTQFILSGWPKLEEMERFGREILPLVRAAEERARIRDGTSG
jgi:alkanesulfonate monooxygenase